MCSWWRIERQINVWVPADPSNLHQGTQVSVSGVLVLWDVMEETGTFTVCQRCYTMFPFLHLPWPLIPTWTQILVVTVVDESFLFIYWFSQVYIPCITMFALNSIDDLYSYCAYICYIIFTLYSYITILPFLSDAEVAKIIYILPKWTYFQIHLLPTVKTNGNRIEHFDPEKYNTFPFL